MFGGQRPYPEEKPRCEMAELMGKTIDEYTKEELWAVIGDFLKPEIKTDEDLNREVEFFISTCKAKEKQNITFGEIIGSIVGGVKEALEKQK